MNRKKIILIIVLIIVSSCIYAVETKASIIADIALYPKPDIAQGGGFAPSIGIFGAAEARVIGDYSFIWAVPFGDNPLMAGNTLVLNPRIELTPISLTPIVRLSFSPIAFLVFNIGAEIGTGWDFDILSVKGLASYNPVSGEYDSLSPFADYRYRFWFEGMAQFDLGVIFPGDWTHIIGAVTYKVLYEGLTRGGENRNPWLWQATVGKANGFKYISSIILGYQMPFVLQMLGIQTEFEGYYSDSVMADEYKAWNPSFMTVNISPILFFKFTEKQSLLLQLRFSSRRSFVDASDSIFEYQRVYKERQWYFDRIALSYTYRFK